MSIEGDRSVCFDQAAGYYDQTRSLPSVGHQRVLEVLLGELRGKDPCLDIGVGTGRIALPLAARGTEVIGVDLSIPMMLRLREGDGGTLVPLAAGDATRLPFLNDAFGSALIIHVLHSVPPWEHVIEDAVRVTRPGGTVLVDPGNGRVEILEQIEGRFIAELGEEPRRSSWTVEMIDEAFVGLGCRPRLLQEIPVTFMQAPETLLAQLERGQASWQWSLDASGFAPAAQRVRTWAEETLMDLDEPRELTTSVSIRAYDL